MGRQRKYKYEKKIDYQQLTSWLLETEMCKAKINTNVYWNEHYKIITPIQMPKYFNKTKLTCSIRIITTIRCTNDINDNKIENRTCRLCERNSKSTEHPLYNCSKLKNEVFSIQYVLHKNRIKKRWINLIKKKRGKNQIITNIWYVNT